MAARVTAAPDEFALAVGAEEFSNSQNIRNSNFSIGARAVHVFKVHTSLLAVPLTFREFKIAWRPQDFPPVFGSHEGS